MIFNGPSYERYLPKSDIYRDIQVEEVGYISLLYNTLRAEGWNILLQILAVPHPFCIVWSGGIPIV